MDGETGGRDDGGLLKCDNRLPVSLSLSLVSLGRAKYPPTSAVSPHGMNQHKYTPYTTTYHSPVYQEPYGTIRTCVGTLFLSGSIYIGNRARERNQPKFSGLVFQPGPGNERRTGKKKEGDARNFPIFLSSF